ncbi:MAG TPA: hypothetical protein VK497_05420 [Candidatus Saccharimonadales bacterium]|nr:hypothetical protein [Candidatus Saccharimonadales bacterium]
MKRITLILLAAVAFVAPNILVFQSDVLASDARNFNAGRIIDDGIFTNSDAMSVGTIQNFLNSKVPACDTWGGKTSELGGGTRAQWLASHGYSTPVTCLRDYYENPANGQSNYGTSVPAGGISAAQIIYNYSKQFNINPQTIIVTLQKENGMVTDEWPTPKQFREAMGFGCPDNTAPGAPACDPSYGSFSAQIYQAARHFRGYIDKPAGWFVPFTTGVNSIAYSPAASCGRSNVNIENRSTVALYSYTPYRPNQAALNAQYGGGDSCSAHGNRNFYLYFTDWFGSTIMNGNFLRTVDNGSLYLISDDMKYPIPDMNIFNALYPLGGVGYVSQSYLDSKTTGQTLGRIIRSPDGTVYFYDAGIRLSFGSCALVEAYGSSCGQSALLTESQVNSLSVGPPMTNVLNTTSGKSFYMDGKKREIYDQLALNPYGVNASTANVLNETALSNTALGVPIVRDDTYIRNRTSGGLYGYSSGVLRKVDTGIQTTTYLNNLNPPSIDGAGVNLLTGGTDVSGFIRSQSGMSYILTDAGKMRLTDVDDWQKTFVLMSDGLLSQIPDVGTLSPAYFVKSKNSGTVYLLSTGEKRTIQGWMDLLAINANPTILNLSDYYINSVTEGATVLSPGGLVKTQNDATVYMVNGLNKKIPMNSFNPSTELGSTTLNIVSDGVMSKYATEADVLRPTVKCGVKQGLAVGGKAYDISLPGAQYTVLSDINCSILEWKDTPGFFLAPNGTIYQLKNSQKLPISGYQMYLNLGGTTQNTIRASNYVLDMFPTGSSL